MHLRITAVPESADRDLTGLYGWFEQVEELRHGTRISLGSEQGSGAMGIADIIDVVLTQAISAGTLGLSYAAYRRANPAAPAVTVASDDGESVRVPDDPGSAERAVASLMGTGTEPDPSEGPEGRAGDDTA